MDDEIEIVLELLIEQPRSEVLLPPPIDRTLEPPRLPEAGWFRDPTDTADWRWWDGHRWTEQTA